MAHTLEDQETGVIFIFDGDMSGDVLIKQLDLRRLPDRVVAAQVTVPFRAVERLLAEKVRRQRMAALEDAEPYELLGLDAPK